MKFSNQLGKAATAGALLASSLFFTSTALAQPSYDSTYLVPNTEREYKCVVNRFYDDAPYGVKGQFYPTNKISYNKVETKCSDVGLNSQGWSWDYEVRINPATAKTVLFKCTEGRITNYSRYDNKSIIRIRCS